MVSRDEDDLTEKEAALFRALPREIAPPPGLERRVIEAAARSELLGRTGQADSGPSAHRPKGVFWSGWAVAASLIFTLGGFWAGRATAPTAGALDEQVGGFVLALYEGPEFAPYTDANFPGRYAEYNEWIAGLRAEDRFVTGLPLDSTSFVLLPAQREPALEERFPESQDGWADGLFVIDAPDYETALAIARTAPHLRYGGRIAVRRISPI